MTPFDEMLFMEIRRCALAAEELVIMSRVLVAIFVVTWLAFLFRWQIRRKR